MFLWKVGIGPAWIIASALSCGIMDISLKLSAPHLTVQQTAMGRFVLGLIFVPVITAMVGQVLTNQGMKYTNPSRKSCFMMIEVFVASAFG
jgi:drug/metabolite transporter (DMT)-like permease